MNLDFIPESARAAGLGAMMKGAGKLLRFIPISQPTLLVGPGASGRLGQAVAGFGHVKILVVTDAVIARPATTARRTPQLRFLCPIGSTKRRSPMRTSPVNSELVVRCSISMMGSGSPGRNTCLK